MALDTAPYERRKRQINDDFAAKQAASTFGRFTSQQRFERNRDLSSTSFSRGLPRFQAGWGRRGLTGANARSGVYARAMDEYVGDHAQSQGWGQQNYDSEVAQFGANETGMVSARDRALADLEAEKADMIAATAMNIQALRPAFA